LSPDNYYNGTFYLRFEVQNVPTSEPFKLQFAIWGDLDAGAMYWTESCSDATPNYFNGTGTQAYSSMPVNWYKKNGGINWSDRTTFHRFGIILWVHNPLVCVF
jgi:hypothetical protein